VRPEEILRRLAGGAVYNQPEEVKIMGKIGLPELLVILAIIVIVFGANRLPGLGKGIGSAIKNFKDGLKEKSE
jgi:sec-independent protein translocase protein TatA